MDRVQSDHFQNHMQKRQKHRLSLSKFSGYASSSNVSEAECKFGPQKLDFS